MSPANSHPEGPLGDGDDGRPAAPSTPAPTFPAPPTTGGPPGGEAERRTPAGSVPGHPEPPVGPGTTSGSGTDLDPLAWPGPDPAGRPDFGHDPAAAGFGAASGDSPAGGGLLRGLAVSAVALLVMILLGLPLGLIWSALAPGVPVVQTDDGALLAQPQPEEFIAADGWFSLLGFGLGVLAAIAVWLLLRRYRGPLGLLLVVLGMIGAAVLAWQVGRQIGLSGYERLLQTAPPGETFSKPPDLHGGQFEMVLGFIPRIQDLLVPAFGAAVMYTLLAGWSRYPGLRPEAEPAPTVLSWDLPVPPGPTATPAPPGPDAAEPPRG
ncbi:DUF2567 domain-containing protein [Plantactinospora soyae]|uniref:DUF2567 domain-containing protein n=1 Tax=Plantactinospora soyae TaxID=1544732 RepID=A0A927MIP6_9ACTN|nr:DUF2567 domain-containing protein [Plantactinospora soyae]MBE1492338.1 hypothetical protein [Plantactinospora soyae]